MRSGLQIGVALAAAWLATVDTATAQLPGLRAHTLEHAGTEREYLLYTPLGAQRLEGDRPLVVLLHGGGGDHRSMVRVTKRKFHRLADRDGFYIVYPNAIDGFWDFGEGVVSEGLAQPIDDLGFFSRLLDEVLADHPIDTNRVFASGISRGGQASYFLGCQLADRVRAIAPFTMPLPRFMKNECKRGPAIGIAIFNGTEDPFVPYEGGTINVLGSERDRVLSTKATTRLWRRRNGCRKAALTADLPDTSSDGTSVRVSVWEKGCAESPVVLYRIEGGGHTWPSGTQYLPPALVGRVSRDIDGAVEAWAFFSTFD